VGSVLDFKFNINTEGRVGCMSKNEKVKALLEKLEKEQVIVAYCCCGNKKTTSTAC